MCFVDHCKRGAVAYPHDHIGIALIKSVKLCEACDEQPRLRFP